MVTYLGFASSRAWAYSLLVEQQRFESGQVVLLDELQLVHVDAMGQAEIAAGDGGAIDDSRGGGHLGFLRGASHIAADGALARFVVPLHFAGNSQAAGDDPFVAFVSHPAPGAETFIAAEAPVLGRSAVGDPRS